MKQLIYGSVGILLLLLFAGNVIRARLTARRQRIRDFYELQNRCGDKAMSSGSISTVAGMIDKYSGAYRQNAAFLNEREKAFYRSDMSELQSHLSALEEDAYQRKADPKLQRFCDCYCSIRDENLDPQTLRQLKKRCVNLWQSFFAIPLEEYRTAIYPKSYLRAFLGDDYDPCMESHEALERKLDMMIRAKPSSLKQKSPPAKPVKSISPPSSPVTRVANSAVFPRHNAEPRERPVRLLQEWNIPFIDMTPRGGRLYFFDPEAARELKERGYGVRYAPNGSKSTGNKPAWYIIE